MEPHPRILVRPEEARDRASVRLVNEAAFGQPDEARLVGAIQEAGAATLSLVATRGDEVVGHILFSPVVIEEATGPKTASGLGPMAVLPDFQRRGVGSRLVEEGLAALRHLGHDAVVVLGHPEY